MKLIIFTDGASRGNPGPASYGFTVADENKKLLHEEGEYIGETTNNVAEYTAVIKAMTWVKHNYGNDKVQLHLFADSRLVVQQLSGRFKIKSEHLKPIIEKIKILALELGGVIYTHIPREQNSHADRMANEALDNR